MGFLTGFFKCSSKPVKTADKPLEPAPTLAKPAVTPSTGPAPPHAKPAVKTSTLAPAVPTKATSRADVASSPVSPEDRDLALALERSLSDQRSAPKDQSRLPPSSSSAPAVCEPGWRACINGCGLSAFGDHASCCRACSGPEGPHARDCETKNRRLKPACASGCGRPAFGAFRTCCTKCSGAAGPHALDCAIKCRGDTGGDAASAPSSSPAGRASDPSLSPLTGARARADVEEDIRSKLVDWHDAGGMHTPREMDTVISTLATSHRMSPESMRMLCFSVGRTARAVEGSSSVYVSLAKKHHEVQVEVVDLGQYSAERSNSCMFLSCAASIYERRSCGDEDCWGLGALKDTLDVVSGWVLGRSTDELIAEHRVDRSSALGRMADALRHAACEVLLADEEFYLPFYNPIPVAGRPASGDEVDAAAFRAWVESMRGCEEGDELVVLALARLCGIAVQPVQRSGYHVPLMDPTEAAGSGSVVYWGNDDRHWIWLRPTSGR